MTQADEEAIKILIAAAAHSYGLVHPYTDQQVEQARCIMAGHMFAAPAAFTADQDQDWRDSKGFGVHP